MNGNTCNFCGTSFEDIYKLERHQRSAKYCLEIQTKDQDKTICKLCKKKCYSERDLKAHKCVLHKDDLHETISELNEKIKQLEQRVDVLEKREKSVSEYDTLESLSQTWMERQLDKFSVDYTNKGVSGYASFALEFIFKNRLLLTDRSRKKFVYKGEDGQKKVDINLFYLSTLFFSVINEKNKELISSQKKPLPENDSDEEEYVMNQWYAYKKYIFFVQDASLGIRDTFVNDFVSIICESI